MSSLKKKGQKYQNKVGYKIKYDEHAMDVVKHAPLDRLCKRCLEQIQWKLKFNKYKPQKNISRCNRCGEKNVIKAYRGCCDSCSDQYEICSKCEQKKSLEPEPEKETKEDKKNGGVDKQLLAEMEDYMKRLRERSRRMILRKIKQNLLTWKDGQFVYKEDGKPIENLKFKKLDDDDFDEDLDDFSDDDAEKDSPPPKKAGKGAEKPKKKKSEEDSDDDFEDVSDEEEEEKEIGEKKQENIKNKKKVLEDDFEDLSSEEEKI